MKLQGFASKYWFAVMLALVVILGAVQYSLRSYGHFLSPDETANASFARAFATTGRIRILEPLNIIAANGVHPRSMVVSDSKVLPGSFIFFPFLAGLWGLMFGSATIPFFTSLLFLGALLGTWFLARRWFGHPAAELSVLFLAVQPFVVLYAVRGLWHNGAAAFLAVTGLALWVRTADTNRLLTYAVGTLCWLLAIAIRPSEAGWMIPLGITLLWALRLIRPRTVILGLLLCVTVVTGLLFLQRWVFGSYTSFGYNAVTTDMGEGMGDASRFLPYLRQLFFPFGIRPVQAFRLISQFLLYFAQPLSILVVVGIIGWWRSCQPGDRRRVIIIGLLAAALYLGVSYGSYNFTESFDGRTVVLGSSYGRYWLPAIMLLAPFAGYGAVVLLKHAGWRRGAWTFFILASVTLSIAQVFLDARYGLVKEIRSDLALGAQQRSDALPFIPTDAVVVTGPLDKVFFPERRVIGSNVISETQYEQMLSLAEANVPVFLVTTSPVERSAATDWFTSTPWQLQPVKLLSGNAVLSSLINKTFQ